MRRVFAILLLAAAGLFAACNDPAGTPPGVTQGRRDDAASPTETPVEPSVEPTSRPDAAAGRGPRRRSNMTFEERRTVVRERVEPVSPALVTTDGNVVAERRVATTRPTGATMVARVVVVVFGLIQLLIGARIVLLALDAREGNALVAGILALSEPFVAPFEGILNSDALASGGAVLDLAAVLALIGWTIVELVLLAVLRIGRSGDHV